jgi:hypothetical protein
MLIVGAFNTYAACLFFDGDPYGDAIKLQPLAFFFLTSKLLPPFLSGFLVLATAYFVRRELKLKPSQPLPEPASTYPYLVLCICIGLIVLYEMLVPEHSSLWYKGLQLLYVLNYIDIPKTWRNTGGNGFPLYSFFSGAVLGFLWLKLKTRFGHL